MHLAYHDSCDGRGEHEGDAPYASAFSGSDYSDSESSSSSSSTRYYTAVGEEARERGPRHTTVAEHLADDVHWGEDPWGSGSESGPSTSSSSGITHPWNDDGASWASTSTTSVDAYWGGSSDIWETSSTGSSTSSSSAHYPALPFTEAAAEKLPDADTARYWGVDELIGIGQRQLPPGACAENDDVLGNFEDGSIYSDYSLSDDLVSPAATHQWEGGGAPVDEPPAVLPALPSYESAAAVRPKVRPSTVASFPAVGIETSTHDVAPSSSLPAADAAAAASLQICPYCMGI